MDLLLAEPLSGHADVFVLGTVELTVLFGQLDHVFLKDQ